MSANGKTVRCATAGSAHSLLVQPRDKVHCANLIRDFCRSPAPASDFTYRPREYYSCYSLSSLSRSPTYTEINQINQLL